MERRVVALLLTAYFATLGILALFGVHRLFLTAAAWRSRRRGEAPLPQVTSWPSVVVQLPIFNEAFVAERLLSSAAALDYPAERLEIQVLDDSTDETTAILARTRDALPPGGPKITLVRRPARVGFKAGALREGLLASDAELVAIFDADFVPTPDFLRRTVPHLVADPRCGLVQARWSHLNRGHSMLTRAQAILLDAHFGIEHEGRAARGACFNFNGTAGVWRRAAIESAGNWTDDTITEDLDLSYRAQMAGWSFRYLDAVLVPGELPETFSALRTQQARWVRGGIETLRKHWAGIWGRRDWSFSRRLEATIHLGSNLAYVLMALLAFLLPLAVVARDQLGWRVSGGEALLSGMDLTMLSAGTLAMLVFYSASIRLSPDATAESRTADLLSALCLGAGLSLTNARAALLGLTQSGAEFVRTPKRGTAPRTELLRAYRPSHQVLAALLELGAAMGYAIAIAYAIEAGLWAALPFLFLYFVGFAAIGGGTIYERLELRSLRTGAPRSIVTSGRRA